MNFRRGVGASDPEINLIPLIDVLLVILIFLMVSTTYARFSELQINLPEAKGETAQQVPTRIEINIDASGTYSLNNQRLPRPGVQDLTLALQAAAQRSPDPVVVISADARATHQAVIKVMDAARRAGLTRVTFVARSPQD